MPHVFAMLEAHHQQGKILRWHKNTGTRKLLVQCAHLKQNTVDNLEEKHITRCIDRQQGEQDAADGEGRRRAIEPNVGTDLIL